MHAYLLRTHRRITPFDEPAGAMKVHNRTLRETQEEILRSLGCAVEEIGDPAQIQRHPCLVVFDDVYFTYHALAGFLRSARTGQRGGMVAAGQAGGHPRGRANARAALATSPLTERFTPTFQGSLVQAPAGASCRAYDVYYLEHLDRDQPLEAQAGLLPVKYRLRTRHARASRFFEPSGKFTVPISPVFFQPVRHWAALVTINLLGMTSFLLRQARLRHGALVSLPLLMLWRAGSLRPSRLRGKVYLAGGGCRVHPTAHVEGVILGDKVRIGAHAVVRGTVIGDQAEIGPGAVVEGCTLGRRALVNGNVVLRAASVDDEASIGSYFTQLSVIGRGAVLCPHSGIYDSHLRGPVSVSFENQTVSSGSRLLGGCLGHGAFLGAEVPLAGGQELPNGCILVRNPRCLVWNVERGLPPDVVRIDRGRRCRTTQHGDGADSGSRSTAA